MSSAVINLLHFALSFLITAAEPVEWLCCSQFFLYVAVQSTQRRELAFPGVVFLISRLGAESYIESSHI